MKPFSLSLILIIMVGACGKQHAAKSSALPLPAATPVSGAFSNTELHEFTALEPIDSHTHIYQSSSIFFAMLKKLHLHIIDIVVVSENRKGAWNSLPEESAVTWQVVRQSDGHASLCTTFDPYNFNEPSFGETAVRQINQNLDQGAIAVKIWKNIGMEIKDNKGNYILPDDPIFEPIYKDIATHNKTLIAHVADPNSSWEPPNPASPDYSYYMRHPEWYMYDKPHPASKEQILRARDHLLEENPNLRVVGAHLGSMEMNFTQLAQDLDRYPNFAVDLAARMPYLMLQPRLDMIRFITKYQDRLLYGTDDDLLPQADVQNTVTKIENRYAQDWRFLATDDIVVEPASGRHVQGLALPQSVLRKLYHDNAIHWFPGILGNSH
ncbi:MAG: amidohydrolase family protein [Silvibacterium sp.]